MDYLPPVVISVEGDITDLQTKLAEAQALLASYRDSGPYSVDVTANTEQAVDNVNALQNALNSLPNKKQIEITVNKINLDNITFDAKTLKAAAAAAQQVLVEEFDKTLIPAYVTFEEDGEYGLTKAAENARGHLSRYFGEQTNDIIAYLKFDDSDEAGLGKACADAKEALQQCMDSGITTRIVFDVDATVDNFFNAVDTAKEKYERYALPVKIHIETDGDIAENYQQTVYRTEEKVRRVVETVKDFTEEPVEESLPSTSPYKQDARGRWRNELGRFVKDVVKDVQATQRNDEGSVESLGFESLYHGTSVSFLRKIFKNGLLPGTRNSYGRGVYTTDEFTDAIIYADQAVRSAPYGLPTYTTSRTFEDDSFNIDVLAQDKLWQPAPAVLKIDVPRKTIEAITSKDLQKEVEEYVEYVKGEGLPYPHNVLGDLFGDSTTLHVVDAGQFVTPLGYAAEDIKEVFAFPDYAKVTAGLTGDFESLEEAFLDEAVDMKDVFEKSIKNVKNTMLRAARGAVKQIKQNISDKGEIAMPEFGRPRNFIQEQLPSVPLVTQMLAPLLDEADNYLLDVPFLLSRFDRPMYYENLFQNVGQPILRSSGLEMAKQILADHGYKVKFSFDLSEKELQDMKTVVVASDKTFFADKPQTAAYVASLGEGSEPSALGMVIHPDEMTPLTIIHEIAHVVSGDAHWAQYMSTLGFQLDNPHRLKWMKNYARIMGEQGYDEANETLSSYIKDVQTFADEELGKTFAPENLFGSLLENIKASGDEGSISLNQFGSLFNPLKSLFKKIKASGDEGSISFSDNPVREQVFTVPDEYMIDPSYLYGVIERSFGASEKSISKPAALSMAKTALDSFGLEGKVFPNEIARLEVPFEKKLLGALLLTDNYDEQTVWLDVGKSAFEDNAKDAGIYYKLNSASKIADTMPNGLIAINPDDLKPSVVLHEVAHAGTPDEFLKNYPENTFTNVHSLLWLKNFARIMKVHGYQNDASKLAGYASAIQQIAEEGKDFKSQYGVHAETSRIYKKINKWQALKNLMNDDAGSIEVGPLFDAFKNLSAAIKKSTIQSQDSVAEVNDSAIEIGRSFSVFKDLADAIKTSTQKFGDFSDPLRSLKDLAEITGQPLSRLRYWSKDSNFPERFDAPFVRRNVGGRTPYLYDVEEVQEFVKLQEQKANTTTAGTVQRFLPVDKNKVFDPSELMTIQDIAAYGNMDVTKAGYLPRLILDFPRAVATQGKRQFWQAEEITQWFEARSTAPIVDPQEVLRMAREYTGANLIRQNVAAWKSWKTDDFPTPINPWNTPGTNLGYLYQREDIEKWLRTSDTIAKLRLANKDAPQALERLMGDEGNVRPSALSTLLGIMAPVPFLDAAVKLFGHGDIKQGLLATAAGAVAGGALPGLEVASQLISRRRFQRSMMESLIESPAINESLPDLAVLADTALRIRGSLESSVPQMNDLERYVQMYPVQISSLRQAMADALPNFESPVEDLLNVSDMIGKMKADMSKFDKVFEVFVQDRETFLNDISPLMNGLKLPAFRVGTNALGTVVNRILRGENVLSYIPSDMTQKLGPLIEAAKAKLEVFDLKRMFGKNLFGDRTPSVITAAQEAAAAQQAAVDAVRPQFEQWKTIIEETTAAYKEMLSLGRWTGSRQGALASQLLELQSLQQKIQKLDVDVDTTRAKEQLLLLHEYARHPETMPVGIHLPMELGATSNMLKGIQQRITIAQGNAVADALSSKPGKEGALGGLFGWLGAKGGGGNREGMLTALGWGKGGGIPLPFLGAVGGGLAGFGSILGLGGFGAEHVVTTGLGIAGSAVGGLIGGGILAGSTLAVAGVGLGTDLAGIGQAGKDAKATYSNYASYADAVSQFGPKSSQATSALQTFLTSLSAVPQAAQSAVLGLDKTVYAFHNMFNNLTGPAEAVGAQILQQAVTVGEQYLPTIGKFAFQNMNILKKGLQPFFSWLQNAGSQGGLGIFIELEQLFQKRLPAAINAFVQGFELIARTIGAVAPQTGQFINKISNFLTKENTSGFGKWMTEVGHLIGLFHEWEGLIKYLILDIAKLFSFTAGLAGGPTGIVVTLTGYLKELYGYLNNQGPGSNLASLFSLHKREVMDILNLAIQLVAELGKAYIAIAPAVTLFFVDILDIVTKIVGELERISKWHNPLGEVAKVGVAGIGFGILLRQMGLLTPLLSGANREASIFAKTIGLLGFSNLLGKKQLFKDIQDSAGNVIGRERVGRTGMLSYLLGARGLGEDDKFVVGKIKNTFGKAGREARKEARNASKLVRDAMNDSGYVQQFDFGHGKAHEKELKKTESFMSRFQKRLKEGRSDAGFVDFGQIFGKAKGGEKEVSNLKKLGEEGEKIKKAFSGVGSSIIKIGGDFASFGKTALKAVLGVIPGLLGFDVAEGATTLSTLALNAALTLGVIGALVLVGVAIYEMITHWKTVEKVVGDVVKFLKEVVVEAFHGIVDAAKFLWTGVEEYFKLLEFEFVTLPKLILGWVADAGKWLYNIGKDIVNGLIKGVESMFGDAGGVMLRLAGSLLGPFKSILGIFSPSTVTTGLGQYVVQGLTNGITNNSNQAISAAKTLSQGIINAFGSLKGVSGVAGAVNSLASVFRNLASVFTNLQKAAAASSNSGLQLYAIGVALQNISTDAPGLMVKLEQIVGVFQGMSNNGGLKTVASIMSNLNSVFSNLQGAASRAANVTWNSMMRISNALKLVNWFAPGMVTNIGSISKAFANIGTPARATTALVPLGNVTQFAKAVPSTQVLHTLNSTLVSVGNMFTNFSNMAQNAANVTVKSVGQITNAINALTAVPKGGGLSAIQTMTNGIKTIMSSISSFSNQGSQGINANGLAFNYKPQTALQNIHTLNQELVGIGNMFNNFATIAKNANKVTPTTFGSITNAIGTITSHAKTMSSSIQTITSAFGQLGNSQGLPLLKGNITPIQALNRELVSVGNMMGNFGTITSKTGNVSKSGLDKIVTALKLIKNQSSAMAGDIQGTLDAFTTGGSGSLLTGDTSKQINSMTKAFGSLLSLFNQIGTTSGSAQSVTGNNFKKMGTAINNVSTLLNQLVTVFANASTRLQNSGGFDGLIRHINQMLTILQKLPQLFVGMATAAYVAQANMKAPLGLIALQIQAIGSSLAGLPDALRNAKAGIVGQLTALVNNMVNLLTGATTYQKFVSAGAAMMSGLVAGINQGSAHVATTLTGVAATSIAHFKGPQGINAQSPSKAMIPLGYSMMEGLAKGIGDGKGLVKTSLVAAVPRAINAPTGSGHAGGGMNVTAHFTINAPGGNTDTIKRAIEKDSAENFAKAALTAMRAGAGTVYG